MRNSLFVVAIIASFLGFFWSCQNSVDIKTAQYAVNGQKVYIAHCQNCHGEKGEGLGNLYPPLTDSTFLKQHRHELACIVKYGSTAHFTVKGKKYTTEMPATTLSDVDIAYVLTYITTKINSEKNLYSLEEVQQNLSKCKK